MYDNFHSLYGIKVASKTYNKVIAIIASAWEQVFNEEIILDGSTPTDRFSDLVNQLKKKLKSGSDLSRLAEQLDLEPSSSVETLIRRLTEDEANPQRVTDVDDLTPNQIKEAIYSSAREMSESDGVVDIGLSVLLRKSLDRVFESACLQGRINVGANRHFPRLYQWVKECEAETDWGDGQGIRVRNTRGRVPGNPVDPKKLWVSINYNYL